MLVWRIINPAIITACAWLLAYAMRCEKRRDESWLICALVFLYQWVNLKTAGWVVTTIAYLWPVCFGLAALCPLWRLFRGKGTPAWGWALACASLLFAANMEQPALVLPFLLGGGMLFLRAACGCLQSCGCSLRCARRLLCSFSPAQATPCARKTMWPPSI